MTDWYHVIMQKNSDYTAKEKKNFQDIIDLTKDLIGFQTTHDCMDQIHACADFIGLFLEDNGLEFRRYQINGYPSILVTPKTTVFPLLLMSHMDVVDAPEKLFKPVIRGNRLFGRGSCDDKYAVALSLVLLRDRYLRLKASGKNQADLGMGVLITADEETGGRNGAEPILREICPHFCIALDGGSLNRLIIKEKGIARVKMISRGRTCHGSRPWLGKNAIETLFNDYRTIQEFFAEQKSGHWNRTMSPGVIRGGSSVNQVPDYCELLLDIRYTELDPIQDILSSMAGQVNSELEITMLDPVFFTRDRSWVDRILGLSPDIETDCEHGASDARHLMSCHLDGAVWGANGNMTQHSLEEHVEMDSVFQLYGRLDRLVDYL